MGMLLRKDQHVLNGLSERRGKIIIFMSFAAAATKKTKSGLICTAGKMVYAVFFFRRFYHSTGAGPRLGLTMGWPHRPVNKAPGACQQSLRWGI